MSLIWDEEEPYFFPGNLHKIICAFTLPENKSVKLSITPDPSLKLLSPSSFKFNTVKEVEQTATVKLYLPQNLSSNIDSLNVVFTLEEISGFKEVLLQEKLTLPIKEKIMIRMESLKKELPVRASDSLAIVPLRIKNMGKRQYAVDLALQTKPKGLKPLETENIFFLLPQTDTLIYCKLQPEKTWQKTHSATLKYNLFLPDLNEKAADCEVTAFPMGYKKKYLPDNFTINNIHELELGLRHNGEIDNNLILNSEGQTPFMNGQLDYEMRSLYNTGFNEWDVTSAYVNYFNQTRNLSLGNINPNQEISLYGKGFLFEEQRDSHGISLGFINSVPLLSTVPFSEFDNTRNLFTAGYHLTKPNLGLLEANSIFTFSRTRRSGLLWFENTKEKENSFLNFKIGGSGQYGIGNISTHSFIPGLTTALSFEKSINNWTFNTENRFSSPFYAGDMAGQLFSYQKINYTENKNFSLSLSGQFRQFKNHIIRNEETYFRMGQRMRYQLQFKTSFLKNWTLSLNPSQDFENRNFINLKSLEDIFFSSSSLLKTKISYKRKGLVLSLASTTGIFNFGDDKSALNRSLIQFYHLNFSGKSMSAFVGYEKGSTNLSNALDDYNFRQQRMEFRVGTRWQKWLFKKRLKLNCSNQLIYNDLRKLWINSTDTRLKVALSSDFSVSSGFSLFKTSQYFNYSLDIKINKKFNSYRPPQNTNRLKVILFEDQNNNGIKDKTEKVLPGIFVKIDNITMVTSTAGWIQYKAVPSGEYKMQFIDPSGQLAGERQVINISSNQEIYCPLYKTIPLEGSVKEIKQRFKKAKLQITGIPIIAKNKEGEIYTTYTRPNGTFRFNLPKDEYQVYIDQVAFSNSFEFPDNFQIVNLTNDDLANLSFSIKVKSRKMNIKKF
jgi:hypothetical protein